MGEICRYMYGEDILENDFHVLSIDLLLFYYGGIFLSLVLVVLSERQNKNKKCVNISFC